MKPCKHLRIEKGKPFCKTVDGVPEECPYHPKHYHRCWDYRPAKDTPAPPTESPEDVTERAPGLGGMD
jgi:hypothetical protein